MEVDSKRLKPPPAATINWGMVTIPSPRRRGRVEILADILSAAIDGARGTHIMYRANINFAQRKKYLAEALSAGLIEVRVRSPLVYVTTEKGHEWLRAYRKLLEDLPEGSD